MTGATVTIKDKSWSVNIASTPWDLAKGLGGLVELPPEMGMLFDLGSEQIIQVTTVPMLFPLDIVFLSEALVVTEVYRNVEPGHVLTSTLPARYFLEVNTGELEGIDCGDAASVEPLALEETQTIVPDWGPIMIPFVAFVVMGMMMVSFSKELLTEILEQPGEKPRLQPQALGTASRGFFVGQAGSGALA